MKISRIYIKIFLSFILLLFVTEIMIFGLFKHLALDPGHRRYGKIIEIVAEVTHPYITRAMKGPEREGLQNYLAELARRSGLQVWITEHEKITFKTFSGERPRLEGKILVMDKKTYQVRRERHRMVFLLTLPFSEKKGDAIHLFYRAPRGSLHETDFLKGLLLIGFILALILFPFARYISRPLKKLRDSALRISRGHLDERVDISGKDEIGQLGGAFNAMAANLEKMVNGTREMAASISHELRSPLARLRVAAEMIEEKAHMQEVNLPEHLFAAVNEEIEEMDRLIGRILDLEKVEMRNASREKIILAFNELLSDALERFSDLFARRSMKLQADIQEDNFYLPAIREDLSMAVNCILDNTARYAPEGSPVTVALAKQENKIIFSVTNRAFDFPPEKIKEVFTPFAKMHEASGAGLGLSLVKKVVENHGGTVEARCSEENFTIEVILPLVPGADK